MAALAPLASKNVLSRLTLLHTRCCTLCEIFLFRMGVIGKTIRSRKRPRPSLALVQKCSELSADVGQIRFRRDAGCRLSAMVFGITANMSSGVRGAHRKTTECVQDFFVPFDLSRIVPKIVRFRGSHASRQCLSATPAAHATQDGSVPTSSNGTDFQDFCSMLSAISSNSRRRDRC